ncbi:MAG: 4-(cytidine 5'-diphospho)-2-C-methyl-D-erythritol kinase [Pseudomonadota bacterium]
MRAELAPAKVNLSLHITGRRPDGYHVLDSLVVFAGVGDLIEAEPARTTSLAVRGPFSDGLSNGADNLAAKAAELMGGGSVLLTKNLPVASGIGGGSADAAAVLRALQDTGRPLPSERAVLTLGADVPVCLAGRPARMSGIGEVLNPVSPLPPAHLVLANAGPAVSTGAVFAGLRRHDNPPPPPLPSTIPDAAALADWLKQTRNDLAPPAKALLPVIGAVEEALSTQPGCMLARMSGSGGTVFGLFAEARDALAAAEALRSAAPTWWVAAAPLLGAPVTQGTTTPQNAPSAVSTG